MIPNLLREANEEQRNSVAVTRGQETCPGADCQDSTPGSVTLCLGNCKEVD